MPGSLCLSAILAAALLAARAEEPSESDPARELLAKAEEQAAKGQYDKARRTYERIVDKHAGTEAAVIAARRSTPSAFVGWADIVRHGPSSNRLDVVLMGDGYTLKHMKAFDKLADDIPPVFERDTTFREYYEYMNFLRASLVSADAGVDGFGREYDTALGGRTLATDAGHVGIDPDSVLRVFAELPEHDEQAIIFVKTGVLGTGGAGMATIGGRNTRTTIHEFGHSFAGLGDEYSTRTHTRGSASARINVSVSEELDEVPWAHWLRAKVPGVGTYEGASGQVRDAFRPTASGCIMNDGEFFCPVCREALVLRIYSYVDPIDACSPPPIPVNSPIALQPEPGQKIEFEVHAMQPASHVLEARWWILRESETPRRGGGTRGGRYGTGEPTPDRRDRGPLPDIVIDPVEVSKHNRKGVHRFVLKLNELDEPGRYRVVCRVIDTTELRGEKWPWVLHDPLHLLQSERAWWVEVPGPR